MATTKTKNSRTAIPDKVKAQLWVAAGGRCEFMSCNKPLDKNILTQQKVFLGQHAHIIADSPDGPRGSEEQSKLLASDPDNIMLMCHHCHTTVDRNVADYTAATLRRMKQIHEDRIQRLYDIDGAKESVSVVLRFPIKRNHVPKFTNNDVYNAISANSGHRHAPSQELLSLDYQTEVTREDDQLYWVELAKRLKDNYDSQLHLISTRSRLNHLSIFAFAPMPLNIQLGALIGNKIEASTYQWDRVRESWCFKEERAYERQSISFGEVPPSGGKDLALVMSLSGSVDAAAVDTVARGLPTVHFRVPKPTPILVETIEDVQHFRTRFTQLMAEIRNQGYKRVRVFPAMPLSLAVEFGRQLLPKADPVIEVWDYQGEKFVATLQIRV